MDRVAQWAKGRPEEADFTLSVAATAVFSGKLKQAEDLQKRSLEMFKQQGRQENAAAGLMGLAGDQLLLGRCDQSKGNVKAALGLVRNQMNLATAAIIYAACDDAKQAQSLLDEARAASPQ